MCRHDFLISCTCEGVRPGTNDKIGFVEAAIELDLSSRGAGVPKTCDIKNPH
jgi:hypothetical protein